MERNSPRVNNNGSRMAMQDMVVARPPEPAAGRKKNGMPKKRWPIVVAVVAGVLLLLAAGLYLLNKASFAGQINGTYQAVFLTNGQVYFGKLQAANSSYLKITNVYYIQNKDTSETQSSASANNIELIQLTSAVHGPKDEIVINRDQVLFFENLDDSGQAAKLISGDKN